MTARRVQKEPAHVNGKMGARGERQDGRTTTEVRPIDIRMSPLPPQVHGSVLFTRGETQSLATATLGEEKQTAQRWMHKHPHGSCPLPRLLPSPPAHLPALRHATSFPSHGSTWPYLRCACMGTAASFRRPRVLLQCARQISPPPHPPPRGCGSDAKGHHPDELCLSHVSHGEECA